MREQILDSSGLDEGGTFLDVGCGEGLLGFGALERGAGTVIFSDVSNDLLDVCRTLAGELGLLDRCRFVQTPAQDLSPIADTSVDALGTRSVLIYVKDKARAFTEFDRVLRPGGRISLFEPINRFGEEARRGDSYWGYDTAPVADVLPKLRAIYDRIQPPGEDPMVDFDERDLIRLAEDAGFFPIELELHVEIRASRAVRWESFLNTAGNPRIPTLAEAMDEALDPDERERLIAQLRPQVEQGRGTWRMATAYLRGTKPTNP